MQGTIIKFSEENYPLNKNNRLQEVKQRLQAAKDRVRDEFAQKQKALDNARGSFSSWERRLASMDCSYVTPLSFM